MEPYIWTATSTRSRTSSSPPGTSCSACGHENREDLKFCVKCGGSLAVACPGCGAPAEVSGEKKHITVLFADVAGSMDLQERLEPEVRAQIMSRFVGIRAEGIRKIGGMDKFPGTGSWRCSGHWWRRRTMRESGGLCLGRPVSTRGGRD
ncbi:MAG: double zinc ribbon domain-containing protein [Acidimicrobiia bacterium]